MKYSQVSYGSSGSDVKTLQEMLNNNGYSLDVDGNFGSKTQAAVKDYQQKNNLAVDGIVGSNTWGALTKATNTSNTAPAATTTAPTYEDKAYQPSDAVTQAEALLNQHKAQMPGDYQSTWQGPLNDMISQILNRDKFSYDLDKDALYQQYKDQYVQQGRMAMMDTMGQAAAMTGGYGNSYAQSVGQQTYQGYLQQLNDVVPELYQMALNQYNQEGQDMYDKAALLGAQEEQDYGRYRDQVSDYYTQLQQLYDQYNKERDYDYSKYTDERNFSYEQYLHDLDYQYQKERDQVADDQWQKEYDFALQQYNDSKSPSRYRGSGDDTGTGDDDTGTDNDDTGTGDDTGSSYNNDGLSDSDIRAMQSYFGVTADGKWGSASVKAAGGLSARAAWALYQREANKPRTVPDDTPSNYKEFVQYLNDAVASGETSKGEISADIRSAVNAGIITQNQAQKLLNMFTPKNATY